MRTLVVTSADESYAGMLRDLVESLERCNPQPYTALACLDVGLAPETREWIEQHAEHVVEPAWDLPVNEAKRLLRPHLRALTARPFLPRYFPGYDLFLWIDSDAWVQEPSTLNAYLTAAATGSIAIASHDHPAYRRGNELIEWRLQQRRAYFGEQADLSSCPANYWNAGVFALRADTPLWNHWAHHFAVGLAATEGDLCSDQLALNHAIMVEQLPVTPLHTYCNWLCHLAMPSYDEQRMRYCDPMDNSTLGILHLSAKSKHLNIRPHWHHQPVVVT